MSKLLPALVEQLSKANSIDELDKLSEKIQTILEMVASKKAIILDANNKKTKNFMLEYKQRMESLDQ